MRGPSRVHEYGQTLPTNQADDRRVSPVQHKNPHGVRGQQSTSQFPRRTGVGPSSAHAAKRWTERQKGAIHAGAREQDFREPAFCRRFLQARFFAQMAGVRGIQSRSDPGIPKMPGLMPSKASTSGAEARPACRGEWSCRSCPSSSGPSSRNGPSRLMASPCVRTSCFFATERMRTP